MQIWWNTNKAYHFWFLDSIQFFSLVSNWRILQHAPQVLSKSAPNVYYGQNASIWQQGYTSLHACTLLAPRPRCSLVALAVRLSPSQVAPRSLPLAVFPSLVAPRSSPLAVFPSPLNVPNSIVTPVCGTEWESESTENVWQTLPKLLMIKLWTGHVTVSA